MEDVIAAFEEARARAFIRALEKAQEKAEKAEKEKANS